jgi:phosphomevalonate kinase
MIHNLAGGYDALWVLVLSPPADRDSAVASVEGFWQGWQEASVRPLSRGARVKVGAATTSDDDRQSPSGLRVENLDHVTGLRAALLDS